jgi:integrase
MEKRLLSSECPKGVFAPDDTWVLRKMAKHYRMNHIAQMLFDNLAMEHSIKNLREILLCNKKEDTKMRFFKQKKSRYFYVDLSWGVNKRHRFSTRCEKKRDAEKVGFLLFKKILEAPGNDGLPSDMPKPVPSFREVSEIYLEKRCRGKKKSFHREELCHQDVVAEFGKCKVTDILSSRIEDWMEKEKQRVVRTGRRISDRSINYNRGYLSRVFEFAKEQKWVDDNPVAKVKPIRLDNKRRRILIDEEQEETRLLKACEQEWFRRVLVFAIETGLRINEICSLKRDQFFLSNGIPHFALIREKNGVETKFPIASERLFQVVREQMESSPDAGCFFTDALDSPVTSNKIDHWLEKAAGKAKITDITCNDFRRTFCSRLYWMGCNPVFVEYLMGHTVNGIHSHYLVHNLGEIYDELVKIEEKKKQKSWHTVGIPEESLVAAGIV